MKDPVMQTLAEINTAGLEVVESCRPIAAKLTEGQDLTRDDALTLFNAAMEQTRLLHLALEMNSQQREVVKQYEWAPSLLAADAHGTA